MKRASPVYRLSAFCCAASLLAVTAVVCGRFLAPPGGPVLGDASKLPGSVVVDIDTEETVGHGAKPIVIGGVLDKQVAFLLDTGGEASLLPEAWTDRVEIESETEGADSNGKRIFRSTRPLAVSLGKQPIDKVRFQIPGPYSHLTHGQLVWSTDGVATLGQNVLCRYRIIIDGPKQELRLSDRDDKPLGSGWVAYQGFWGSQHLTVPAVDAQGRPLLLFIDSGYERSRIAKTHAAAVPYPINIRVGGNHIIGSTANVLDGGDLTISSPEKGTVVIGATLGWDVLRGCRLEVSYKHRQLRITQKTREPSDAADSR